ncbi:MAG: ComF family protein [Candidatus Delongbacteria bacterium]|nr:ComF family protein [Candidatus Delongbacteria bacterium]
MKTFFKNILSSLSSFLFPASCLICEEYLHDELFVCRSCLSNLKLHKNTEPEYIAVFQYDDKIKKLIFELKYNSKPEIGEILGKEAAKHISDLFQNSNSILFPVPLHKKRIKKRGYNQSLYIAKGFSQTLKLPIYEDMIVRSKNNVSQTTVKSSNRKSNVSGIFRINTSSIDKNILFIVVDDLITTQATTKEIYRILKENGYNNYFGLCIATSGS